MAQSFYISGKVIGIDDESVNRLARLYIKNMLLIPYSKDEENFINFFANKLKELWRD